ncbi:acyltransferase family protein [Dactylosporangium matsuzakiense]|uniref:Acyltransferase 3 domain-containing protein n=1 Tax=Dactylosporangium matsuzakiense TaxID=53360 RepID=A0A9W6NT77_9ACTN|nr:acyltransferase family protein [Dactylosporangium matsuzakiense]GLL08111.1 hypothetical protein GCM10017581_098710 [Dactylosporangium matsuzakiense]
MAAIETVPARATGAARQAGIDRLRVALTVGVIATHAVITYAADGSWFYHEGRLPAAVDTLAGIPLALGALFGMGTFFFLAGAFLPASLARHGQAALLRERALRLGVPTVVFVLLLVPAVEWWVAAAQRWPSGPGAIWAAQLRQLDAGPLWFVWVLLLFTAVSVPILARLRPAAGRPLSTGLLAGVAGAVAVVSFLLRIWFPIDSFQPGAAHLWQWGQCAGLFVLGLLAGRHGWLDAIPARIRRACIALTVLGSVATIALIAAFADDLDPLGGGLHWQSAVVATIEGLMSVSATIVLISLFRPGPPGPLGATLTASAYGAYLLQTPVLVGIALALRHLPLPSLAKLAILMPAAVLVSFAGAALLRHVPKLRPVLR